MSIDTMNNANTMIATNKTKVMNETKLIPGFTNEYVAKNAKVSARQSLWVEFLLGHSSHYILEESLNLFRSEGDKWISLIFGPEGLDFRLEGYAPQEGEVIVVPKLHISAMEYRPGEDIFNLVRPYLKGAQFCTREEARQIMADYRERKKYDFLPFPPLLVEVESLPGSQSLMEIDAALR